MRGGPVLSIACAGVLAGALVLAGCGAETSSGRSRSHTPAVPKPVVRPKIASTTPPAEPQEGLVTLMGVVLVRERLPSIREDPLGQGIVVAMPIERFRKLQEFIGPKADAPGGFDMPRSVLGARELVSSVIKPDGIYSLGLAPGEYALCLADLDRSPDEPKTGPVRVNHWLEVTVTADELQTVVPVIDRASGEVSISY